MGVNEPYMNRTAEPSASDVGRKKKNWALWLITIFFILPAVLIILYTWAALNYAYSSGERADINGGAIIDHEAPRERRFVAVQK
jgi:hypothetical protein